MVLTGGSTDRWMMCTEGWSHGTDGWVRWYQGTPTPMMERSMLYKLIMHNRYLRATIS